MDKVSATAALAEFVARTGFEDLPPEVCEETKRTLLDSLGCALGATTVTRGKAAIALAAELGGNPQASILGASQRVSCVNAAFANSELINALEFDPILVPGHVSAFAISAPLALAEREKATGKALITALAAAHEVGARVGASMRNVKAKGGVPVGVAGFSGGIFASAAGAGKILRFDAGQVANAFGLAGPLAPVPSRLKFFYSRRVSFFKYAPAGWMAQGGLMAALLSEKGYTGEEDILDREHGFWTMHGSDFYEGERITEGLGQDWLLLRTQYKRWPSGGALLSVLDALDEVLSRHGIMPEEIESVTVAAEPFSMLPAWTSPVLESHMDAQFRTTYNVAVAAHRIAPGPAWQQEATLRDERIQHFRRKVRCQVYEASKEIRNTEMGVEGKRPAQVKVVARGKTLQAEVDYAKWTPVPGLRATNQDLENKFRTNASYVMTKAQTDAAVDRLWNLERLGNVAQLLAILRPDWRVVKDGRR
ncbi:MAG: MmgE/PrpD family protein [Chloroflexi bacterium]|nr:MmgE/PrpD family protein [Chloroflexota bacterium]